MSKHKAISRSSRRKKLSVTCKEASEMIVVSEFESLSFKRKVSLWYHLLICKVCRLFQKQSAEINEVIKRNEQNKNIELSLEKKEEFSDLLSKLR